MHMGSGSITVIEFDPIYVQHLLLEVLAQRVDGEVLLWDRDLPQCRVMITSCERARGFCTYGACSRTAQAGLFSLASISASDSRPRSVMSNPSPTVRGAIKPFLLRKVATSASMDPGTE